MSQVSSVLRRSQDGYMHWCPGCKEMHRLPDTWKFNGNLEYPSFEESFNHGNSKEKICHYVLTNGVLNFCNDCTHALKGQSVPLPKLPCI